MGKKKSNVDPAVARLDEIETHFVSLVDRGANRQDSFFVVKSDGGSPAAVSKGVASALGEEAFAALMQRYEMLREKMQAGTLTQKDVDDAFDGQWKLQDVIRTAAAITTKGDEMMFAMTEVLPALEELAQKEDDDTDKVVCPHCKKALEGTPKTCPYCGGMVKPSDSGMKATDGQKKDQAKRAEKYGIEAVESDSSSLEKLDGEKSEDLYGDPVNGMFPLHKDGKMDSGAVGAAMVSLRRNYRTYAKEDSLKVVVERVVKAAIGLKLKMRIDAESPVDKLVSEELLKQLEELGADGSTSDDDDTDPSVKAAAKADMAAWLEGVEAGVNDVLVDIQLSRTLDGELSDSQDDDSISDDNVRVGKGGGAPSDVASELAVLRKKNGHLGAELKKLKKALRTANAKLTKSRASIGSSVALLTGEEVVATKGSATVSWGGDLAQE